MKEKTTKKHSAAKKLIPATCMLLVSALTLVSSTYAWFTMSREVEVQNIKMTATVPEDIQLSLGVLGSTSTAAVTDGSVRLADNSGYLVNLTQNATNADNGTVTAPTGNNDNSYYWSNTADISHYYTFGKLIPASSKTGEDVYFTPDANGVGKTVKDDASFYMAADGTTPYKADVTNITYASDGTGFSAMATAHAVTSASDKWGDKDTASNGYTAASEWLVTHDDGYYVDIPVWLRTSSISGAELKVSAYVIPQGATTTTAAAEGDRDLYKAVRVAILNADGTARSNIIPVANGLGNDYKVVSTPYSGSSIVDTYGDKINQGTGSAVSNGVANATGALSSTNIYEAYTAYTANASVASLAAPTISNGVKTSEYGAATKIWIRVWLEGEDPDCWNDNAGQDWSINLKFEKGATAPGNGG